MIHAAPRASRRTLFSAALIAAQLLISACPAAGDDVQAEHFYRRADPIIAALERYKQVHDEYPDSLDELPPEWLPPPAEEADKAKERGFHYTRKGDFFELSFGYTGPGVNRCNYDSTIKDGKKWQCSGYY